MTTDVMRFAKAQSMKKIGIGLFVVAVSMVFAFVFMCKGRKDGVIVPPPAPPAADFKPQPVMPPIFMVQADNDGVKPENSLNMYLALRTKEIVDPADGHFSRRLAGKSEVSENGRKG